MTDEMLQRDAVEQLADLLGATWPAIARARRAAAERRTQLTRRFQGILPVDASLVGSGSIGRAEVTQGSDVDWILLIDGQAAAGHLDAAYAIDDGLVELRLKQPGRERTFGSLAFSHDLLHNIGGESDTNANVTRRILLLLESHALTGNDVFVRVRRQILKRYISEDVGWHHTQGSPSIPLFLLNDISRYWRTVAVDFAQKRRVRRSEGWALRAVKLSFSRKLTYVAGLLTCFGCAEVGIGAERAKGRTPVLIQHLERALSATPLDTFASTAIIYWDVEALRSAWHDIFQTYDVFLALLDDEAARERLEHLKQGDAATDPIFLQARDARKRFQKAIETIFFDGHGTPFPMWTRRYGVF
jgi:hypothetical protein